MLIINADDFGRSSIVTDHILSCYKQGSVTSTSAMVFMEDSQRAADLAREHAIDVGLHLNFDQRLTQQFGNSVLCDYHARIAKFLNRTKYNSLIYNPTLRKQFIYVFQAQFVEFYRLYGKAPSHINGHHHMHLCANMFIEAIIPKGQKVRRNFSFARGEKNLLNRFYRACIDKWLMRRYLTTDYFFSLQERMKSNRLTDAITLAKTSIVELETHPEIEGEFKWLMGNACNQMISHVQKGSYAQLSGSMANKNNLARNKE